MRVNNQTAPFCHHDSNSSREEGEGTPDLPDPRMANRAIELDNDSAEGYLARGYLETQAFGRYEPTASDFERALELSPNSADAHGWYAHLLVREGHDDEAFAENEMAIEIDPLAPGRRMGLSLIHI